VSGRVRPLQAPAKSSHKIHFSMSKTTTVNIQNDIDIEDLHTKACERGDETYIDPATGFTVFTRIAHENRGSCCGMRCRHCPYDYENVPGKKSKAQKKESAPIDYEALHSKACADGKTRYKDPATGKYILTKIAHRRRGRCCNTGCRHCPYKTDSDTESSTSNAVEVKASIRRRKRRGIVYTKRGDKGTSQLFTGERQSKDGVIFEALGTVDELNANLGCVRSDILEDDKLSELTEEIETIIAWLLDVGSHIATPRLAANDNEVGAASIAKRAPTNEQLNRSTFDPKRLKKIEAWIDLKLNKLTDLTSFVLPCGSQPVPNLHVCRTVCRRAERRIVSLVKFGTCDDIVLKFINRLSDYLFVLARYVSFLRNETEMVYSSKSRSQRTVAKIASTKSKNVPKNGSTKKIEAKRKDSADKSRVEIISQSRYHWLITTVLTHAFVALLAFIIGLSWES